MIAKAAMSLGAVALMTIAGSPAAATPAFPSEEAAVRSADAAFWRAFDACDAASMAKYLTDDVEFYHDTTGLTRTRANVVESMMKGPCGTPDLHMRRELVGASARYQPVPGYGAMWSGDHIFFARKGDGAERPATHARFMVIWRQVAGQWEMARVISYDHAPIPYTPPEISMTMPVETLKGYVGRYHTATAGDIDVSLEAGSLILRSGTLRVTLAANAPDHFFALERDLQFVFSPGGAPTKIEVHEAGAVVASGTRTD